MPYRASAALTTVLSLLAILIGGCFGANNEPAATAPAATPVATAVEATPTATPTPAPPSPSAPTPEPEDWWIVAATTWDDAFEITLEIYGPSTITDQTALRARSRVTNVSDEPAAYVRWSQHDPAVPMWIVLPHAAPTGSERPALRLIHLLSEDDDLSNALAFPEVKRDTLDPGGVIEREVSWDLTVRADTPMGRGHAADDVYTLRADFYSDGPQAYPGRPDVSLTFPITLSRGIRG